MEEIIITDITSFSTQLTHCQSDNNCSGSSLLNDDIHDAYGVHGQETIMGTNTTNCYGE